MSVNVEAINKELKDKSPAEIVAWAIQQAKKPVVTTNFRPYESAILHAVAQVKPDVPVIWADSGYNTKATYKCAFQVIKDLKLNVFTYIPQQTAAYRDALMDGIPGIDSPLHDEFTKQVKLEPFKRAMAEHKPDVWFTNLRQDQTEFRRSLDIISYSPDGMMKVAPFFYWSDEQLDEYLEKNNLPNEHDYYDPTKVLGNRECGLHTAAVSA